MIELNEQELEQVAGGTFYVGSTGISDGGAYAEFGLVKSYTYSKSTVNTEDGYSSSKAGTKGFAIGFGVSAGGTSATAAGASE